jgi:hypothetical protein
MYLRSSCVSISSRISNMKVWNIAVGGLSQWSCGVNCGSQNLFCLTTIVTFLWCTLLPQIKNLQHNYDSMTLCLLSRKECGYIVFRCWFSHFSNNNQLLLWLVVWSGCLQLDSQQGKGIFLCSSVSRQGLFPMQPVSQWVQRGRVSEKWSWTLTFIKFHFQQ